MSIYIYIAAKTKIFNLFFFTFSFCEKLWPKLNHIHFICLFMGACVQDRVTSSYMDAVLELVVHDIKYSG